MIAIQVDTSALLWVQQNVFIVDIRKPFTRWLRPWIRWTIRSDCSRRSRRCWTHFNRNIFIVIIYGWWCFIHCRFIEQRLLGIVKSIFDTQDSYHQWIIAAFFIQFKFSRWRNDWFRLSNTCGWLLLFFRRLRWRCRCSTSEDWLTRDVFSQPVTCNHFR